MHREDSYEEPNQTLGVAAALAGGGGAVLRLQGGVSSGPAGREQFSFHPVPASKRNQHFTRGILLAASAFPAGRRLHVLPAGRRGRKRPGFVKAVLPAKQGPPAARGRFVRPKPRQFLSGRGRGVRPLARCASNPHLYPFHPVRQHSQAYGSARPCPQRIRPCLRRYLRRPAR